MSFIIRRATFADLHLVAPLFDAYRQFYEQPANLSLARVFMGVRLKQGDSHVLLALEQEAADVAIGFAQMYPSFSSISARPIMILNDLYVTEAARHRGVAKALLCAAREIALQMQCRRVTLAASRDNAAAQQLYESLGFAPQKGFLHYDLLL
ncbi:MAG: GNAT family N-acetyltransferase [Burkholderiaceae bacterium]|nr:MAG: GNAT family N-acetyltransferase [Burkholderiaceae bacterium]